MYFFKEVNFKMVKKVISREYYYSVLTFKQKVRKSPIVLFLTQGGQV